MENDQLSDIGEPVEIDLISSEIDEDTVLAENITVTDNFSGDKVDFDMERTDGGIELTFPQGIKADNSYTCLLYTSIFCPATISAALCAERWTLPQNITISMPGR